MVLQVRRAKKQPAAEAPEEAEAEVDTTGLTTMQAWAARRAAKRAGEKKKPVAASKAAPTPAPRKRTATKVRGAHVQCLAVRPGKGCQYVCRSSSVSRVHHAVSLLTRRVIWQLFISATLHVSNVLNSQGRCCNRLQK